MIIQIALGVVLGLFVFCIITTAIVAAAERQAKRAEANRWAIAYEADRTARKAELERIGAEGEAAWAAAVKDAEEKKAARYKDRVRIYGEQRAAELTAEYEAKGIEEWMLPFPAEVARPLSQEEPLSHAEIEAEFARLLGRHLPDDPAELLYLKIEQAKVSTRTK
jgi:hypothetical protein